MSEQAAHLRDHVFPRVPVRQWVLSVPHRVRYHLARKSKLKRQVLAIFIGEVFRWMRRRLGRGDGQGAAVTVVQRFGGSLNLNVHMHSLVVDGLYVRGAAGEKLLFIPVPVPEPEELQMIVERVGDRVIDLLLRRGVIEAGDCGDEAPQPAQEPAALERLQAASIQGLLAFSPTLKGVGMLGRDLFSRPAPRWGSGVPEYEGFTLHALNHARASALRFRARRGVHQGR